MTATLDEYHRRLVTDLKLLNEQEWREGLVAFGGETNAAGDCDGFLRSLESRKSDFDGRRLSLLTAFQRERVCDPTDNGQSLLVGGGKYRLLDRLGKGGQAEVFLARNQEVPARLVAIKRVSFHGLDTVARERWNRECAVLCDPLLKSRPDRTSVVTGIEFLSDATGSCLVMEWVRGDTLSDLCGDLEKSVSRLSVRHALLLADSIARGLEFLHAAGCVHRDVKPANLILSAQRSNPYFICIVDLGLVKVVDGTVPNLTHGGMGTHYYSSPECMVAAATADTRADLYGLAAVLFKLLCGEVAAFELCLSSRPSRKELADFSKWIDQRRPWKRTRLDEIRSDVPAALADLVARCLDPDPAGRPANIQAFRAEFDPLLYDARAGRTSQRRLQAMRLALQQILSVAAKEAGTHTPQINARTVVSSIRGRVTSPSLQFPLGCQIPARHKRVAEFNPRLTELAEALNQLLVRLDQVVASPAASAPLVESNFDEIMLEIQLLLPRFLALEHLLADYLGETVS